MKGLVVLALVVAKAIDACVVAFSAVESTFRARRAAGDSGSAVSAPLSLVTPCGSAVSRLRMTRSLRHRFQADRTHYPSRALHLMVRCQKWSDLPLRSRVRPRYRPVELGSLGGGSQCLARRRPGSCGHHEPAGEHGGQRSAQHAPFRIRLHSRSFSRQEPAPLAPGCPRRCRTVSILTPSLHLAPDRGKDDRKNKGMEAAR